MNMHDLIMTLINLNQSHLPVLLFLLIWNSVSSFPISPRQSREEHSAYWHLPCGEADPNIKFVNDFTSSPSTYFEKIKTFAEQSLSRATKHDLSVLLKTPSNINQDQKLRSIPQPPKDSSCLEGSVRTQRDIKEKLKKQPKLKGEKKKGKKETPSKKETSPKKETLPKKKKKKKARKEKAKDSDIKKQLHEASKAFSNAYTDLQIFAVNINQAVQDQEIKKKYYDYVKSLERDLQYLLCYIHAALQELKEKPKEGPKEADAIKTHNSQTSMRDFWVIKGYITYLEYVKKIAHCFEKSTST